LNSSFDRKKKKKQTNKRKTKNEERRMAKNDCEHLRCKIDHAVPRQI
jgi:hypothetical protein